MVNVSGLSEKNARGDTESKLKIEMDIINCCLNPYLMENAFSLQSLPDDGYVQEITIEIESPSILLKQPTDRKEKRKEKEDKTAKKV